MHRDLPLQFGSDGRGRPSVVDPDLLPTRKFARDALVAALRSGRGPVLLTGDSGVGKTMLRRLLQTARKAFESWAVVEIAPRTHPDGFYRLLARELRVSILPFDRAELLDFLSERSLDSGRSTLAIEEAHNLDAETLEEVRILADRLGEPDGFAAILLVGHTSLAYRLADARTGGFASRLAAHVHLRPVDADEASQLLGTVDPGRSWPAELVDRIHLASRGRPARLLDFARSLGTAASMDDQGTAAVDLPSEDRGGLRDRPAASDRPWDETLVGPARPPIRVEDGLIEVGWQPELGDEAMGSASEDGTIPTGGDPSSFAGHEGEEPIDDHYAALQAWQEWAKNQGRLPGMEPPIAAVAAPSAGDLDAGVSPMSSNRNLRAEEEQAFAPFGRLFTRLSQEKEPERS